MAESNKSNNEEHLDDNESEEKSQINGHSVNGNNNNNDNTDNKDKENLERIYMIGTRILKRDYNSNDRIDYDSDPFGKDLTVPHKHKGSIITLNKTEKVITIKNENGKVIPYKLDEIAIELEQHESDNENEDGLSTLSNINYSKNKHIKTQTTADITNLSQIDPNLLRHTGIALKQSFVEKQKNTVNITDNTDNTDNAENIENTENTEKRKQEIEYEESYAKLVKSIDDDSKPRVIHNELNYRPYEYISTAVTRPNMKENMNGGGVLYTEWNREHEFNYFRYWIGRYHIFRDNAKEISNDLKTVILRDEYDLENIREDMLIENDNVDDNDDDDIDDIESMILNEAEFEKYQWNHLKKTKFRLICCEVIDTLPFYKNWIDEIKRYDSINDLIPKIDTECPNLPCPALYRLLIVSKFYKKWINQNFNDHLQIKNKFHFSVHDFMDCLEHYNSVEFQNDYQHLQHCHIEPINSATKVHHGDAFGLNVGTVQNPYSHDDDDEDDDDEDEDEDEDDEDESDSSDDDDDDDEKSSKTKPKKKKKKKDKYVVVLDSENRNIYEWFEDNLGDCDPSKCAIFERTYRSRYDSGFENNSEKYYGLNDKEISDWLERVSEIQYQRIFDGMHTILFHSSARFDCMGLGNSEEHRKFVMLSTEKRKTIKANTTHHRGYTMPHNTLFK